MWHGSQRLQQQSKFIGRVESSCLAPHASPGPRTPCVSPAVSLACSGPLYNPPGMAYPGFQGADTTSSAYNYPSTDFGAPVQGAFQSDDAAGPGDSSTAESAGHQHDPAAQSGEEQPPEQEGSEPVVIWNGELQFKVKKSFNRKAWEVRDVFLYEGEDGPVTGLQAPLPSTHAAWTAPQTHPSCCTAASTRTPSRLSSVQTTASPSLLRRLARTTVCTLK